MNDHIQDLLVERSRRGRPRGAEAMLRELQDVDAGDRRAHASGFRRVSRGVAAAAAVVLAVVAGFQIIEDDGGEAPLASDDGRSLGQWEQVWQLPSGFAGLKLAGAEIRPGTSLPGGRLHVMAERDRNGVIAVAFSQGQQSTLLDVLPRFASRGPDRRDTAASAETHGFELVDFDLDDGTRVTVAARDVDASTVEAVVADAQDGSVDRPAGYRPIFDGEDKSPLRGQSLDQVTLKYESGEGDQVTVSTFTEDTGWVRLNEIEWYFDQPTYVGALGEAGSVELSLLISGTVAIGVGDGPDVVVSATSAELLGQVVQRLDLSSYEMPTVPRVPEETATTLPGPESACAVEGEATVVVPDVVGLTEAEAVRRLEAVDLRVVEGVASTDLSNTVMAHEPPAGTSVVAGACVGLRTEVPAAPVPSTGEELANGRHVVHVTDVSLEDRTITVDVIEWLTGASADEAYAADTGDTSGAPNDYFVRNTEIDLRTLEVDASFVTVAWKPSGPFEHDIDFVEFPDYLSSRNDPEAPFSITVLGDRVLSIAEHYRP